MSETVSFERSKVDKNLLFPIHDVLVVMGTCGIHATLMNPIPAKVCFFNFALRSTCIDQKMIYERSLL